jgi:hypothetical protein
MIEGLSGQVHNGVIVPDQDAPQLPEGARVRFAFVECPSPPDGNPTPLLALIDRLDAMPSDPNWPTDAARQHDHYPYGAPKRP